jgi:cell division septum initiation protein DivIVA
MQALEAKAQGFHEQLRAFRERDKAINEALISAQQLRGEVREQAEREAQLIIREAKAEAERIVANAGNETKKMASEIELLSRQKRSYLTQLRMMVERQLAEIQAVENASVDPAPARTEPEPEVSTATPAWLDSLVKE